MELAPGRHKFGLRVAIPESVPSSFESQFGSIRYSIRLQLIGNADHVNSSTFLMANVFAEFGNRGFPVPGVGQILPGRSAACRDEAH